MVQKYEIKDPIPDEDPSGNSIIKNVTLRSGSNKSLSHFSKCIERTTDVKTWGRLENKDLLNECYIDLTLDKLRELDSDRKAQESYIYSRSKFLDKNMINVLMIKLRIDGNDLLNSQDYEYINALLSWSRNDLYIMPVLEFGSGIDHSKRLECYNNFVIEMLSQKSSWINDDINIGMSIPSFYPRRPLADLFEIYGDEKPTFVAIDFNNSRMDKPDGVVATVLKHFREYNEENTFMYGVNLKPYKKGPGTSSAWDIYAVNASFNAIGPAHSKARPVVLPGDWGSMGRIFDSDEINYPRIDESHRDSFIYWMSDSYHVDLDQDFEKNSKSLYPYLKRYNFEMTNNMLGEISTAIKECDKDYVKNIRNHMPDEMKSKKIIRN